MSCSFLLSDGSVRAVRKLLSSLQPTIRVPKSNPFLAEGLPREVLLFGEPRLPPPYDGKPGVLLMHWIRHGHVVPTTSLDRRQFVYPLGPQHPKSELYRLRDSTELTYDVIVKKFSDVAYHIDNAKDFVSCNIDQIPPRLLLLAMTDEKLAAQSRNQLERMETIKSLRERLVISADQLLFPTVIELIKAETRVQTYRSVISDMERFSSSWDEVEISFFFAALMNARIKFDGQVQEAIATIESSLDETAEDFQESVRDSMINALLVQPALSAEIYLNATRVVAQFMPDVYAKVAPELKFLHETYFLTSPAAIYE